MNQDLNFQEHDLENLLSQQDAPPHLSSFQPSEKLYERSFTAGCIESRWTLKHKPEVKVLTLMRVVLNSWALFLLSFWKSSPGAGFSPIYQSRPHPSAAGRYNWHSSHQKSLQDSTQWGSLWAVQTLSGPEPRRIYTWQFGDEKKKN